MSKSDTFENDLMKFIFQGTALPAGYAGPYYVALYTADPGEAGTATTNEATYTSYARQSIARTSGGFAVTTNTATNVSQINFPQCTGGTNTLTHFAIVTTASGAGIILYSGTLSSSLAVSNGITPQIAASAMSVSED